jgi:hypothetical protein
MEIVSYLASIRQGISGFLDVIHRPVFKLLVYAIRNVERNRGWEVDSK